MLIVTNKFDKCNSKYECDMCKRKISATDRITVSTAENFCNARKKMGFM